MADQLLDIANDGRNDTQVDDDGNEFVNRDVVARSRLRIDTAKWYLCKLAPKRYGDRLSMDHNVNDGVADLLKAVGDDPRNSIRTKWPVDDEKVS
jgi:hypothetical protein